jgi:hypothetical protein
MGEGVSEELLSANAGFQSECDAAAVRSVYPPPVPALRRDKRPTHRPGAAPEPQSIRITVVRDIRQLERFKASWSALAKVATDANVYYEPWWLLPSLHYLHPRKELLFLLMFTRDPVCPTGPELLCGMFPFEVAPRYRGLPVRVLRLLRPKYNRLCTPLVHREFSRECVSALLVVCRTKIPFAKTPPFRYPRVPA